LNRRVPFGPISLLILEEIKGSAKKGGPGEGLGYLIRGLSIVSGKRLVRVKQAAERNRPEGLKWKRSRDEYHGQFWKGIARRTNMVTDDGSKDALRAKKKTTADKGL